MFKLGNEYTRDEIHAQLGGSTWSYLPTNRGVVVAACLTIEKNPQAPRIILCGVGPRIAPYGTLLWQKRSAVPVFMKRAVNRWQYVGVYRPVASYISGPEFERAIAGSGRDRSDVSRVIVMMPTA